MDGEERRRCIVEVAMPLFARAGFAGTTTKEIAAAAGVSEALLFRHFPSKAALYEEILRQGCRADPAFERLTGLEPSTATLIHMMYFMVHRYVAGALGRAEGGDVRQRLMINSFLEDGEYARVVFEAVFSMIFPQFAACLAMAEQEGHLVALPVAAENRFWFAQHVAGMLAYVRLPGRASVPYRGEIDELIAEAGWFVLRGLGLKDEVIAQHYDPKALSLFLETAA